MTDDVRVRGDSSGYLLLDLLCSSTREYSWVTCRHGVYVGGDDTYLDEGDLSGDDPDWDNQDEGNLGGDDLKRDGLDRDILDGDDPDGGDLSGGDLSGVF